MQPAIPAGRGPCPQPTQRGGSPAANGVLLYPRYMPGLAGGRATGTIRKRVIGLEFRAATIGGNGNTGPGGTAFVCTPVAIGNGTWDVKVVYGDAKVHEDGSAFFEVPSRKPLYFQAIDDKGRAAQTMRSWSTLQPGEFRSCAGCHDHKNSAPDARAGTATRAMSGGPQALEPFHGPPRGFSFAKEIQPILNRNCIDCHNDRSGSDIMLGKTVSGTMPSPVPRRITPLDLRPVGHPRLQSARRHCRPYAKRL